MDSLKNRYYIRFIDEKSKEVRLPLTKKRTVIRCIFHFILGKYEYVEVVNEAYLDKRNSGIKRDKNGNLVRGFSETKRQKWYGDIHDDEVNKFKEGLYDPESNEGYNYQANGISIKPFDEEQLDNIMTAIELINEDNFDD